MLDPDVLALLEPGSALIVGTVSPDGEPRATRAWALLATDVERGRLRALVSADDPVAVANLAEGARVAVTGADVVTLRSAQVKGEVRAVEAATADDLSAVAAASERFFDLVLETDGTPLALQHRLLPNEVVAVELVVTERFDQSPGPDAGAPLQGEG